MFYFTDIWWLFGPYGHMVNDLFCTCLHLACVLGLLLFVQLTIQVWTEPKIKRPGASLSPIVHLKDQSAWQHFSPHKKLAWALGSTNNVMCLHL